MTHYRDLDLFYFIFILGVLTGNIARTGDKKTDDEIMRAFVSQFIKHLEER